MQIIRVPGWHTRHVPHEDEPDRGPKQRQVMTTVLGRIESGEYAPGTRVPSIEDLAREFGYSKVTVNNALKALAAQGVLDGERRSRYSVTGVNRGTLAARVARLEASDAEIRRHLQLPPLPE